MMSEVIRGRWASAYCNREFILVETWSGYRGMDCRDHKGVRLFLTVDVSDEELGQSVKNALQHSRWVLPVQKENFIYPADIEFDFDLFDYKKAAESYEAWVKYIMHLYGYKSKKALFKNMKSSHIAVKNEFMKFIPLHHAALERWEGLGPDDAGAFEISANSAPSAVGAALRLAFARSTE